MSLTSLLPANAILRTTTRTSLAPGVPEGRLPGVRMADPGGLRTPGPNQIQTPIEAC